MRRAGLILWYVQWDYTNLARFLYFISTDKLTFFLLQIHDKNWFMTMLDLQDFSINVTLIFQVFCSGGPIKLVAPLIWHLGISMHHCHTSQSGCQETTWRTTRGPSGEGMQWWALWWKQLEFAPSSLRSHLLIVCIELDIVQKCSIPLPIPWLWYRFLNDDFFQHTKHLVHPKQAHTSLLIWYLV